MITKAKNKRIKKVKLQNGLTREQRKKILKKRYGIINKG